MCVSSYWQDQRVIREMWYYAKCLSRGDDWSTRRWMTYSETRYDMKIIQLCIWQIEEEIKRKNTDWDIVKLIL